MLTKDLLRVSRAGGGFQPTFAGREHRPLAAKVLGTFQGHVGERRAVLDDALAELERDADDYKLVRGFAKLLEREATFETDAEVDPENARRAAFAASERGGAITESARSAALASAADALGTTPDAVDASLFADLEERQVMTAFDSRWGPDDLLAQYNLSLAQTALFDATEVRVRSSEPRALVSAVKRLRLMYEIHRTDAGRVVVVTGPDALFRATRRYGTRFARLLRTVVKATDWHLEATIDDRGTERDLTLSDADPLLPPGTDPIAEVTFDSDVEADFATRFSALDFDWELVREPEALKTGARVMIPDFAFDYRHADFRVYFEIMGFWTPEYVAKKLQQLDELEAVDMLVAVDQSLGVGPEIEARDHRAIPYSGAIRLKDVREVLRGYEDELVAESAASLSAELAPGADVVSLSNLAGEYGVSEDALAEKSFPEHELVGRTLVRPAVLDALRETIEPGMSLSDAEVVLANYDLTETSAVLGKLGYKVEWEGLSGGTVRET